MKVRDIMTTDVITVRPDAPYKDIVVTLVEHDISSVPVVNAEGCLLGLVSEADLMAKEAFGPEKRRSLTLVADYFAGRDPGWLKRASGLCAREVMTAEPAAAGPDDDIAKAAQTMLARNAKALPVVEAGRVVGMVARHDLLAVFDVSDAEIAAQVEELLNDPWRTPEGTDLTFSVADGVVTLEGTVLHPSDRAVIAHAALRIPGVVDVVTHLSAREPEPSPA